MKKYNKRHYLYYILLVVPMLISVPLVIDKHIQPVADRVIGEISEVLTPEKTSAKVIKGERSGSQGFWFVMDKVVGYSERLLPLVITVLTFLNRKKIRGKK